MLSTREYIDVLTKMVYVSLCVLSIDNGETVHDAMIKFKWWNLENVVYINNLFQDSWQTR